MIVLTWAGLTQYAVRNLRAFIRSTDEEIVVISERTKFLAKNLEEDLAHPVIWVDGNDTRSISEIVGVMPRVLLASGWGTPCFLRWTKEVKAAGGHTIVTPDEAWGVFPFLHDFPRAIRYRLFLRRLYDRVFVCGAGGRKLFRFYGVPDKNIEEGLYSGDPTVFYDGKPLSQRAKKLIYVGRYIPLKNVLSMCEAFIRVTDKFPDWTLELYGNGELETQLPRHPRIHVNGYVQTEQLGALYRDAQIFILGSWHDNWGVVVHEAALSGCLLLLSKHVGAAADFATPQNAAVFNPFSVADFSVAMERLMSFSDEEKDSGQKISVKLAQKFSPDFFASQMKKMADELG